MATRPDGVEVSGSVNTAPTSQGQMLKSEPVPTASSGTSQTQAPPHYYWGT